MNDDHKTAPLGAPTGEDLRAAGGTWRLTARSEFSASHCLRNYGGKCESVHGHNFAVEIEASGERLTPDTELVADFGDLKRDLKEALDRLDHRHLNDVPPFDTVNPSSERLAQYLSLALTPRLESRGARLERVTVWEKATQSATYEAR